MKHVLVSAVLAILAAALDELVACRGEAFATPVACFGFLLQPTSASVALYPIVDRRWRRLVTAAGGHVVAADAKLVFQVCKLNNHNSLLNKRSHLVIVNLTD